MHRASHTTSSKTGCCSRRICGVCGEQRQPGDEMGVRDPMKLGAQGADGAPGGVLTPSWEKNVSLALQ